MKRQEMRNITGMCSELKTPVVLELSFMTLLMKRKLLSLHVTQIKLLHSSFPDIKDPTVLYSLCVLGTSRAVDSMYIMGKTKDGENRRE
jgi:hypothetical protein